MGFIDTLNIGNKKYLGNNNDNNLACVQPEAGFLSWLRSPSHLANPRKPCHLLLHSLLALPSDHVYFRLVCSRIFCPHLMFSRFPISLLTTNTLATNSCQPYLLQTQLASLAFCKRRICRDTKPSGPTFVASLFILLST